MRDGEIVEIESTRIEAFKQYFPHDFEFFEKEALDNSKIIKFRIELLECETPMSIHGLYLKDKLDRIQTHREIASKFFQSQNYRKACKIYQRIISFFTLDEIYNNLKDEDKESDEWKNLKTELDKIQITAHTNVTICKAKI